MKRLSFLLFVLMLFVNASPVLGDSAIRVLINGKYLVSGEPSAIVNGRTMVPLRPVFEALGLEPKWDETTKTVTAQNSVSNMSLTIGNPEAMINNMGVTLDAPGVLINGNTMVPARFIAETFGASVEWMEDKRIVVVKTKGYESNGRREKKTLVDIDGNTFTGDMVNDFFEGEGILTKLDGTVYTGDFKKGRYDGTGILTWKSGDKYEGGFKDGLFEGEGKFLYASGERYVGSFAKGERNGEGQYYIGTRLFYTGTWKNNLMHGYGTVFYQDGSFYKGDLVEGKREGRGNGMTWKNDCPVQEEMPKWDMGIRH